MKIFLILLTALILRLINLNQSLWLDEAINVVYSQKYNFIDFLTVYSLGDFHPPLHFGLLWIWTRFFGISEIAVRIPSVFFGVLTVWLTYLIGKNLFNEQSSPKGKKTGLVAAAILAFNPLHIYYSQEARMYSLAAFAVAFSFWSLINFLQGKKYFFWVYSASVLLILYSDYLVYLVLFAQLIYIVWQEREKLKKFLLVGFMGGILWIPWLFIFPSQLKTGQAAAIAVPGWANVVGAASLKELGLLAVKSIIGRVSFADKYLYSMVIIPILALYGFISFKALRNLSREIKLILIWVLVPVILALLISFYIPIFAYFRMIFILPGISLILATGIMKFSEGNQRLLLGTVLSLSLIFILMYYVNPQYQREDWKEVISFAKEGDNTVLFEDANIPAPAIYYGCDKNCLPGLKNFPAGNKSDLADFETRLTDRVYLFNYLVEISDPKRLLQKKLESLGYKNTQTRDFSGVGFVYEYSK